MSFLEIFVLVLTGAGTLASILGIFLSKAARENGKATRELIRKMDEENRKMHQGNKEILEKIEKGIEKLGELIVADGERTREIIKNIKNKYG